MKYETIGGGVKDTYDGLTVLRFLRIGDRFTNKNRKGKWEVMDEQCNWNGQAGSPTRRCRNIITKQVEHKLCRIEVIKL